MAETVAIGADHRGYPLKESLKAVLAAMGATTLDLGTCSADSVDYPDIARTVAQAVATGAAGRGILICGSGIGMSIVANKFPGVRAALCHDLHTARMSRQHNDANILVLGSIADAALAAEMLRLWCATPFEGGRHRKRIELIAAIEQQNFKPMR